MSFSYDPDLDTDLDRVRFNIADTEKGSGPKPNNGNFQNEEIAALITEAGKWQLAVAACLETLASGWSSHSSFTAHNGSFSGSDTSARFWAMAQKWRDQYGDVVDAPVPSIISSTIARSDGYS